MNQMFNRIARLTIGVPPSPGVLPVGIAIATPLRISFDLSKGEFSLANIGTITINNLSEQTRKAIHISESKSPFVAYLETGYVDNGGLQLLYYGDVVDVSHNIEKPEVVTTITVMDGHNAIKEGKVNISYRKGTPISKIIKDTSNALGLPLNVIFNYVDLPSTSIDGSLSFVGNAATFLDRLCDENGLTWSVQNGSLKICSLGQTDNTDPLQTVLIGSPKRLYKNMISQSLNDFSGYEFNCLLSPKMAPNGRVTIQSLEVPETTLKIAEVKHVGDTQGEDWKTTVKARDL